MTSWLPSGPFTAHGTQGGPLGRLWETLVILLLENKIEVFIWISFNKQFLHIFYSLIDLYKHSFIKLKECESKTVIIDNSDSNSSTLEPIITLYMNLVDFRRASCITTCFSIVCSWSFSPFMLPSSLYITAILSWTLV